MFAAKTEKISTGLPSLDSLLAGGFPRGAIAHIYGAAGTGKTNLCLCAAAACAAKGGTVFFIDTEGSFNPERFFQISKRSENERILIKQVYDFDSQKDAICSIAKKGSEAGLLIIDSFTALYRLEQSRHKERAYDMSRELGKQLSMLAKFANEKNCAVVLTNHVFGQEAKPIGGDYLLYWPKIILEIKRGLLPGRRTAILHKHPFVAEGESAKFRITAHGIE